jgi:hypothetical protein
MVIVSALPTVQAEEALKAHYHVKRDQIFAAAFT